MVSKRNQIITNCLLFNQSIKSKNYDGNSHIHLGVKMGVKYYFFYFIYNFFKSLNRKYGSLFHRQNIFLQNPVESERLKPQ